MVSEFSYTFQKKLYSDTGPPGQVAAVAGKKDGMKQGEVGGLLKELGYTSDQVRTYPSHRQISKNIVLRSSNFRF